MVPLASPPQVTNMARAMVINYGFSEIGPFSLMDPSAQSPDMIMRMMARNSVSCSCVAGAALALALTASATAWAVGEQSLQERTDVAAKGSYE